MVFASAGCKVHLYDQEPNQVARALEDIAETLRQYEKAESIRGLLSAEDQINNIYGCSSIQEAVTNVDLFMVMIIIVFNCVYRKRLPTSTWIIVFNCVLVILYEELEQERNFQISRHMHKSEKIRIYARRSFRATNHHEALHQNNTAVFIKSLERDFQIRKHHLLSQVEN